METVRSYDSSTNKNQKNTLDPVVGFGWIRENLTASIRYSMSRMVGGRRDTGTLPSRSLPWRCSLLASKRLPSSRLEGAEPPSLFFFLLSSSTEYAECSALTSTEDCRHRPADAVSLDEDATNGTTLPALVQHCLDGPGGVDAPNKLRRRRILDSTFRLCPFLVTAKLHTAENGIERHDYGVLRTERGCLQTNAYTDAAAMARPGLKARQPTE